MPMRRKTCIISLNFVSPRLFQRVCPHFIGPDPDSITEIKDKYLAVSDFVCIGGAADGFHHFVEKAVFAGDFKLNLGHKSNSIFGAAVNLGLAALTAVSPLSTAAWAATGKTVRRTIVIKRKGIIISRFMG